MSHKKYNQSGFSAVELLITLFIGTIFLIAGYQLYLQVTKNSTEADQDARASNLAYEILKKKQSAASNPCVTVPSATVPASEYDNRGLSSLTVTYSISCPYTTSPLDTISKLTVTATYNNRSIQHAMYVTK